MYLHLYISHETYFLYISHDHTLCDGHRIALLLHCILTRDQSDDPSAFGHHIHRYHTLMGSARVSRHRRYTSRI